jgi:hypothetical protein
LHSSDIDINTQAALCPNDLRSNYLVKACCDISVQPEMLVPPVHAHHRILKDPRAIGDQPTRVIGMNMREVLSSVDDLWGP